MRKLSERLSNEWQLIIFSALVGGFGFMWLVLVRWLGGMDFVRSPDLSRCLVMATALGTLSFVLSLWSFREAFNVEPFRR